MLQAQAALLNAKLAQPFIVSLALWLAKLRLIIQAHPELHRFVLLCAGSGRLKANKGFEGFSQPLHVLSKRGLGMH
jgi:hypothetical protein